MRVAEEINIDGRKIMARKEILSQTRKIYTLSDNADFEQENKEVDKIIKNKYFEFCETNKDINYFDYNDEKIKTFNLFDE